MNVLTSYGEIDSSHIIRDRILLDNDRERTLNLEYRVKRALRLPDGRVVLPDEIIKRSAHVSLKAWPEGFEAGLGEFISKSFPVAKRSLRPTGTQPGEAQKNVLRRLGHMFRFANVQGMCTSFKQELLNGSHAFGAQGANSVRTVTTKDTFKLALFLVTASRSATDTVYNTTGELAASGNYSAGGTAVTNATAPTTSGTTAFWTPSASASWAALTSSGAFDCAVLYNTASTSSLEVAVLTFGSQSITAGTFTLTMPTNDSSNAMIRLA